MKWLDRLEEILISFLIATATLVIFVAVVHRYLSGMHLGAFQDFLLDINLSWAQELCIILFVWMAKFGAAYGVRQGIHVGVDVLVNRLSAEHRRLMIMVALGAGVLFTGLVSYLGANLVWENGMAYATLSALGLDTGAHFEGPTTPDLEWATWKVYLAVPLGSALMCFRFLQVLFTFWKTGDLPHHDHAHVDGLDDEPEHYPVMEQKP